MEIILALLTTNALYATRLQKKLAKLKFKLHMKYQMRRHDLK